MGLGRQQTFVCCRARTAPFWPLPTQPIHRPQYAPTGLAGQFGIRSINASPGKRLSSRFSLLAHAVQRPSSAAPGRPTHARVTGAGPASVAHHASLLKGQACHARSCGNRVEGQIPQTQPTYSKWYRRLPLRLCSHLSGDLRLSRIVGPSLLLFKRGIGDRCWRPSNWEQLSFYFAPRRELVRC